MSIPDYQSVMLPLLRFASRGGERTVREAVEFISSEFSLTEDETSRLLPSGSASVISSRVGWARTYLKQAGLIESPKRGVFRITEAGRKLIADAPERIDISVLTRYPEFKDFLNRRRDADKGSSDQDLVAASAGHAAEIVDTPEEQLANAYVNLRRDLESELLESIKAASPAFFEQLVIDVLVSMGYGGSRQDAGRAVGKSGDGGIDGIIKEDRLGLDTIYVQAKRWADTVGRPEIQKFAGALQGQRATKGVFITTSSYSREAIDYVGLINARIILIDGPMLVKLMVDHNVGVTTVGTYEIKKVDSDYFDGT